MAKSIFDHNTATSRALYEAFVRKGFEPVGIRSAGGVVVAINSIADDGEKK